MNLTKSIVAAALAVITIMGIAPAAQAQTRTSLSISYRDDGYRGDRDYRDYRDDRRYDRRDYRDDRRRNWNRGNWNRGNWDRDRDGIPNRYDRYDNRRWGWDNGYGHRDQRRCWDEWRYYGPRGDRTLVRICR